MDFKITLNLQRKAMIAISQYLWQQPEIQDEIHDRMHNFECETDDIDWEEFTRDEILSKLKKLDLPAIVKSELFYIVKEMGKEIFFWHEFLFHRTLFSSDKLDPTKKLYWTPLGKIDVQRVIEENWLKNLRSDAEGRVFDMCLDHGLDKQRVAKISKDMAECYEQRRSVETKREAAFYYVNRNTKKGKRLAREFGFALDGELLKRLVSSGNCESVKSLWPRLNQSTRDSIIMEAFGAAYDKSYTDYGYHFTPYRFEEIFVFLFDNMTNQQKLQVLRDSKWYMLGRLSSWPWLSLLMPTLDLFWANIESDSDIDKSIMFINGRVGDMIEESKFEHSKVMFNVLREVLQRMPAKINFDVTETARSYVSNWGSSDRLQHLMNCSLFEDKKDQMIEAIEHEYVKIKDGKVTDKIADLNEFVEQVFLTVEEQDAFRTKMQARSDFINMKEKKRDRYWF